jgi:cation:H+ antiporter
VVSLVASGQGKGAIAIGNVVGSNVANIGLILGATALIAPPRVAGSLIRREIPVMLLATLAVPLMLANGTLGRVEGLLLLLTALLFTYATLRWSKRTQPEQSTQQLDKQLPDTGSKLGLGLIALLGLGTLVAGGKLFVSGAVGIALWLGMSEHVVGLTVVAIGTSLPELAASLVAALRGHSEIAVGNVVGSNIFNLLLILGAASLLRPIAFPLSAMWLDGGMLVAMTLVCTLAMRGGRVIRRWEGAAFLFGYVAFLIAVVTKV